MTILERLRARRAYVLAAKRKFGSARGLVKYHQLIEARICRTSGVTLVGV